MSIDSCHPSTLTSALQYYMCGLVWSSTSGFELIGSLLCPEEVSTEGKLCSSSRLTFPPSFAVHKQSHTVPHSVFDKQSLMVWQSGSRHIHTSYIGEGYLLGKSSDKYPDAKGRDNWCTEIQSQCSVRHDNSCFIRTVEATETNQAQEEHYDGASLFWAHVPPTPTAHVSIYPSHSLNSNMDGGKGKLFELDLASCPISVYLSWLVFILFLVWMQNITKLK